MQYQNPMLAFLTYDDEHHHFALVDMTKVHPTGTATDKQGEIGVDHVVYTYASLGDLLDTYTRLKQQGIVPYWPVHHGPTLSLYYRDPDGNQMEFQVDCFPTAEEGNAYMYSETFATNPIGVQIDPDSLVEQYRSGVPEAELLKRPEARSRRFHNFPARPRRALEDCNGIHD